VEIPNSIQPVIRGRSLVVGSEPRGVYRARAANGNLTAALSETIALWLFPSRIDTPLSAATVIDVAFEWENIASPVGPILIIAPVCRTWVKNPRGEVGAGTAHRATPEIVVQGVYKTSYSVVQNDGIRSAVFTEARKQIDSMQSQKLALAMFWLR
jgi:hypothetical protein